MEQRKDASGEAHAEMIGDGAEGDGILRDEALSDVVQMGGRSVAGGDFDAVCLGQVCGDAFAVFKIRLAAAAVLPGIQRTDSKAGFIHVDDAVHLAGQTDRGNTGDAVQDIF